MMLIFMDLLALKLNCRAQFTLENRVNHDLSGLLLYGKARLLGGRDINELQQTCRVFKA